MTSSTAAATTIAVHHAAFAAAGLDAVWSRVVGLVVQPGVEFDHNKVIDYLSDAATELSRFIESQQGLVFEAHSTDYQTEANLKALVRDHFAILKVGPGVTFALRETLWGLADIEREWLGAEASSDFKNVVLEVMKQQPEYWQKYYCDVERERYDLQYSLSDRMRYYWPHPRIQAAQAVLFANLESAAPPLALLSQYLPDCLL